MFIGVWEREFPTTLKVLKAFPADKGDYKPHERSRSAKEMAWTFVTEEQAIGAALDGAIDFTKMPPAPATLAEAIAAFEVSHKELVAKVKAASDDAFSKNTIQFYVAPKQMGPVKVSEIAWMMLMDSIHHRGQFSVYLRMAGGKVPSIYGPSADEPWM